MSTNENQLMKPHLHWKIACADVTISKQLKNVTEVTVSALSETEAIAKAKQIIKRTEYQVIQVSECYQPDTPIGIAEMKKEMNLKESWEPSE